MTWQFKRKIVSRILIFLLLIGVLTVGLRILPPVRALGWEVDPSGDRDFTTIQEAIDNADIGITDRIIVFPSIYNENIKVTKSWKITADDPTETIIHGNGSYHTVTISANNTKIEGFTIEYGMSPYSGVFLNGISNSHITGNIISMNGIGITIAANSTDSFIENNSLFFNQVGMRASGENTSVAHNRIKDNLGGVELDSTSSYFTLINNTIVLNQGGVRVFGSNHRIEKLCHGCGHCRDKYRSVVF